METQRGIAGTTIQGTVGMDGMNRASKSVRDLTKN